MLHSTLPVGISQYLARLEARHLFAGALLHCTDNGAHTMLYTDHSSLFKGCHQLCHSKRTEIQSSYRHISPMERQ